MRGAAGRALRTAGAGSSTSTRAAATGSWPSACRTSRDRQNAVPGRLDVGPGSDGAGTGALYFWRMFTAVCR